MLGQQQTDLQKKVEAMRYKAAGRREENRARMPKVAAFVDMFKDAFGEHVKVIYASENGITLGTKDSHDWIVPNIEHRFEQQAKSARRK